MGVREIGRERERDGGKRERERKKELEWMVKGFFF